MAFNKLKNSEDERLTLLIEECAEVVQIVCKIQRHGYGSTHPSGGPNNRRLLEIEVGHVRAALEMMFKAKDLNETAVFDSQEEKKEKVVKYLHHQRSKILKKKKK